MMKLTKQSHKNYRVTLGKNQQEEKRLELRNKLLEKASYFEDNIWIRDFIKIKQSLNEINLNCDYANVNDSGRFQSLSASFTDPNRRRRVASSPAKKSTTTQQSSASLTLPSRSHLKSAPPLSMPPKSAPYSENCSINRTVTNLTNNKYFLSPGKIYKSYTSLVGPKFDRTKEELESFSIKNAFLDSFLGQSSMSKSRCLSGKSLAAGGGEDSLFNIEESYWHDDDLPLLVYSSGEEDETTKKNVQINILNDPNERYKSIRRSQARSGSSKDILFQMKSLKSKTNFSLESNKKLYNFSDRTVRYGDPLPQRPLYRELRILSKFELTAAN